MAQFEQGIGIFDGTFLRDEEVIDYVEKVNQWQNANVEQNGVVLRRGEAYNLTQAAPFFNEIVQMFMHYVKEYQNEYPSLKLDKSEAIQVIKYRKGEFFTPHTDAVKGERTLSAVLFLNNDFEGGVLNFPSQKLEIEARPGRLVFYPSNFLFINEIKPIGDRACYLLNSYFQ
jgi:Rps23 Pro-64 3,4-dihydroxylase Tpa1-like proline 4-hydroxylase